jgi:hypothetical protein
VREVRRCIRARREGAGERAQPRADGREPEELEARERDEAGREQYHPGGEQHDAQGRDDAETAAESGDAEARRDDREERQPQTRRSEVVHDRADRDGDEADDGQMHAGGYDRHAECARGAASGRRGEYGDGEDAVGGEEEARDDGRAVEDVAGEVVEGAEPGEVQVPPQRVAGGQDGDDDAGGEGRHRAVTEVVGMVTSPVPRTGRAGDRDDALAFGRGEEGQRTHVLQVRRCPEVVQPPKSNASGIVALCGRDPQISGGAAANMITP